MKTIIKSEMDSSLAQVKFRKFLKTGTVINYVRKETILDTDITPKSTYFWIVKGYVKVCSYNKSGGERIHYIYGPNDLFPLGWLFKRPYQWVSFIALNKVTIITKSIDDFKDFIIAEPFILTEVIEMQLSMHDRIYNLNLDSAEQRVAHCLLTLASRFGVKRDEQITIALPLTQQEFADTVRLSRETTGKVLNEMEEKSQIILGRKRIVINTDKLVTILD